MSMALVVVSLLLVSTGAMAALATRGRRRIDEHSQRWATTRDAMDRARSRCDPAAALVVDGQIVAAAEEERFSRRKYGKTPVAFSTWELPEASARWCVDAAG